MENKESIAQKNTKSNFRCIKVEKACKKLNVIRLQAKTFSDGPKTIQGVH